MNPIVWFEIPVGDMPRAKSFYEKVFQLEITEQPMGEAQMGMFPWEQGKDGASGALIAHKEYTPSHSGTLVYFGSEDIDGTLERVIQNGGKVLMPKFDIGEYGFCGTFEDTEGNRVALHSNN